MKQTKFSIGLMTFFFAAGMILSLGCNQSESNSSEEATSDVSVDVVKDDSQSGCCGKCALEETASKTTEACCGKCAGESKASNEAAKSEASCPGDCNACAKGDPANCKCDEASTTKSTITSEKKDEQVNTMAQDRDIFHSLLQNHDKITRTVTEIEGGVKTVTESTDAAIASKIQEHVASMYKRVEDGRPLRMWDELYREIFKHADKIKMEIKKTEKGIAVTETSDDPYVAKLIQSHAKVVTGFTKKGFEEARLNHSPPKK